MSETLVHGLAVLSAEQVAPVLLDVRGVAALLCCSPRHVFRLAEADKMPPPVRVGHLVRWRRSDIDAWLAAGCPAGRNGDDE